MNGVEIMNNPQSERLSFPRRATPPAPVSWQRGSTVNEQSLFLSSLPVIDDVASQVCRRHHLIRAEAEDFAAEVRFHFLDRDGEALRRFEGRSSLRTYLIVVIQRLFLDYRNRLWGRWRPSADARRFGPTAMLAERLIVRDGWTFGQAVEMLRTNHQVTVDGALLRFCEQLSPRAAGRQLVAESEADDVPSATPPPDANVLRAEQDFLVKRVRAALGRARQALEPEHRLILKMRFDDGVPVVAIARALHLDQKRLYRTIERLLADLCARLAADGITRTEIEELFADGTLSAVDDRDAVSGSGSSPAARRPDETARAR